MLKSLYSKMLAWLLLNLLLIALVGGGFVFFVLFSNTYGLVPASLFSSNVENVFRVLSTELQYRSTQEWSAIVKAYDRPGLQFHLVSLDDPESLILPQNVVPVASDTVDEPAAAVINKVTAQLGMTDLIALNQRSVDEELPSSKIASDWLTEKGLI